MHVKMVMTYQYITDERGKKMTKSAKKRKRQEAETQLHESRMNRVQVNDQIVYFLKEILQPKFKEGRR